MRRIAVGLLSSSCVVGALLVAPIAAAQPKGAPAGPARSSTQFTLRRDEPGVADAQAARGRARAGDCAGALPSFDAALHKAQDPTVYRDRGLCHENLGHPFPAIDDYRLYLTARPEAPDADQIRQRLAALEEQTGTGGPSARSVKEREKEQEKEKSSSAEASASFSIGSGGAKASSSSSSETAGSAADGSASTEPGHSYDYYAAQEKLADAAEASPLRYGSGVVLGPFLHLPRFWVGEGASGDLAYGVGAALRYSTGRSISIISEIGYSGVGTSGEVSASSGPLLMGGVELRLPVTRFASDHILLRGGVGYERQVVSGTRAVSDIVLGRFGLGFRHVFGPSFGFEVLADGGPAYVIPEMGDSRFNAVVGASFALLVGF
jgi:Tetratricopeptide repeat